MTVLSGGLSGGHLWDTVLVDGGYYGVLYSDLRPMLPMTAEDLGGITEEGGVRWPFCATRDCPTDGDGPCLVYGHCFYFGPSVC